MADVVIILFFLFAVKHFIIDFPLQREFQWRNKGTYGHPGGIEHAGLHAFGTFFVLYITLLSFWPALVLGVFDGLVHYHIDWAKMTINSRKGWGPNTHAEFWWLLGLDQFLHSLTYILIIGILLWS
jgi:Protein of unknown function (DUF3307)